MYAVHTVHLMSKLTLMCAEHTCVLQFLLSNSVQIRMWHKIGCKWVNFRVLHASYISYTACNPYIMCCMKVRSTRVILHTTGFTREYLPLVSYYLQVQNCTTGVTCEYFQLISNHLRAVYSSCCTSLTYELSTKFLEAQSVTGIFCKFGCGLYCS